MCKPPGITRTRSKSSEAPRIRLGGTGRGRMTHRIRGSFGEHPEALAARPRETVVDDDAVLAMPHQNHRPACRRVDSSRRGLRVHGRHGRAEA